MDVLKLLEEHGMNLKEIRACTFGYRPFVMGGNVHYIAASKIPCEYPVDAGKGFFVCLIKNPANGKTFVVECTTGAVVGDTIEQVKKDIVSCDDIVLMQGQIDKFKEQLKTMDVVEMLPEKWWNLARKHKGKKLVRSV